MKCPNCGASVEGKFCEYCGSRLESDNQTVIINNYYGANDQQADDSRMMGYYSPAVETISKKNRTLTLILCFFVGIFGVHYFYVGKIGIGIVYFITAGLFGIGWLVDIIRIAVGSFRDADGFPVKEW